MKLVKMSLVAIIATGAMTTIASATPLEEAIKGVDASGYLRYRYTNNYTKNDSTQADHAFKGELTLKTPIQDNFQAVLNVAGNSKDGSGSDEPYTDTGATFAIQQFYGVYTLAPANTSFIYGKQKIGGFLVDDIKATGLKVINTSIPGWTFAGVAFDALQKDDKDLALYDIKIKAKDSKGNDIDKRISDFIAEENVYALGVMGNIEAGSFSLPLQIWGASVTNIGEMYALDLQPTFNLGDFAINGLFQFGMSKFDKKVTADTNSALSNGKIFIVGVGSKVSMFDLSAGYINYKADNYKYSNDGGKTIQTKTGVSAVTLEDSGQYTKPGELLLGYNGFSGDNKAIYLTASFGVDNVDGALEFISLKNKEFGSDEKTRANEYVARVGYKVNKNLKLSSYYAFADYDKSGTDENQFRFEAKYSF